MPSISRYTDNFAIGFCTYWAGITLFLAVDQWAENRTAWASGGCFSLGMLLPARTERANQLNIPLLSLLCWHVLQLLPGCPTQSLCKRRGRVAGSVDPARYCLCACIQESLLHCSPFWSCFPVKERWPKTVAGALCSLLVKTIQL